MAGAAQAAPAASLPSHETPNRPDALVVPFAMSTPPAVREQRSYQQLLALWRDAGAAYGVPWEVLAAINKIESDFGRNMGPSSAGALGWMQFMPSTWMRWGLDASGDGVANPWNPDDAIYAAARYLAAAGAHDDLDRAIFAYNHAQWYVNDVLELAQVFAAGGGFDGSLVSGAGLPVTAGPQLVFQIDDIEKRLE
ncbi:MAG: lytic transglycosylase domain-containing protein, partial [Actinomycetota bacterium]|nr:lytic transglycosylase domain-containing protein [Actinomycetota bacterium]